MSRRVRYSSGSIAGRLKPRCCRCRRICSATSRRPPTPRSSPSGTTISPDAESRQPNDEGASSHGHITFVDNNVDQTTGTIRIKATYTNEDRRLWPGQFVNVVVALTKDPTAVVVPTAAVQVGQQGQYAYVVKA